MRKNNTKGKQCRFWEKQKIKDQEVKKSLESGKLEDLKTF
jgi:hypothetical protein